MLSHGTDLINPGLNISIIVQADILNEKPTAAFGGEEHVLLESAVQSQMVFCRKARSGYKFD